MEATRNKRAVIVGIFIVVGLLILVATILTLTGQKKTFVSALTLRAEFDDVGGLQKGNNVWYSGVKVGVVKNVTFGENGKVLVSVSVEEKVRDFIRQDAYAKIGTDGLIGNKIVVIYGGTPQAPEVKDGDMLQVRKAVSTDDMMATLQDNNQNLVGITENLKVITGRLAAGEGTLGAMLKDSSLYLQLNNTLAHFRASAANAEKLTNGLSNYIAMLDKPGTFTHDLIRDTAIMKNIDEATAQLREATTSASDITENLKLATASLNEKLNSRNSPAGVLLNDEATAQEIKELMKNLNAGSAKLDENMEALQHNFLFRGFFRKKAKREKKEAAAAEKAAGQNQ